MAGVPVDDVHVILHEVATQTDGTCEDILTPGRVLLPFDAFPGDVRSSSVTADGRVQRVALGTELDLYGAGFYGVGSDWQNARAVVVAAEPWHSCTDRRRLRLLTGMPCVGGILRARQKMITIPPGPWLIAVPAGSDARFVAQRSERKVFPESAAAFENKIRPGAGGSVRVVLLQQGVRTWEIAWLDFTGGNPGVLTDPEERTMPLNGIRDVLGGVALEDGSLGVIIHHQDHNGSVSLNAVVDGHLTRLRWLFVPDTCP